MTEKGEALCTGKGPDGQVSRTTLVWEGGSADLSTRVCDVQLSNPSQLKLLVMGGRGIGEGKEGQCKVAFRATLHSARLKNYLYWLGSGCWESL